MHALRISREKVRSLVRQEGWVRSLSLRTWLAEVRVRVGGWTFTYVCGRVRVCVCECVRMYVCVNPSFSLYPFFFLHSPSSHSRLYTPPFLTLLPCLPILHIFLYSTTLTSISPVLPPYYLPPFLAPFLHLITSPPSLHPLLSHPSFLPTSLLSPLHTPLSLSLYPIPCSLGTDILLGGSSKGVAKVLAKHLLLLKLGISEGTYV